MSVEKEATLERFVKSRSKVNVPDVGWNLVPDFSIADGEGALPELDPYVFASRRIAVWNQKC